MNPYKIINELPAYKGVRIKLIITILLILFIISYGAFNARNMILGPSIEIFDPILKESEVKENVITVKGKATNVTILSINERTISIDTKGLFEEQLLLSPGFNIIVLKGRDRFRKEIKETIKVYYKQQ